MEQRINRIGQMFGRLTVTARSDRCLPKKVAFWLCDCKCGTRGYEVRAGQLQSGRTQSCGCLQRERSRQANSLPKSHGMRHSSEYKSWRAMKARCYVLTTPCYGNYGGRGVTVCEEWRNSFEAFYSHVGPKPSAQHSIDRINNSGNYEPGNVRWATRKEQQRNKRTNVLATINGETRCVTEWLETLPISAPTAWNRINQRGMTPEEALTL